MAGRFPGGYDEGTEAEVELCFTEAGEARVHVRRVFLLAQRDGVGVRNDWPTIMADVGLGTMTEGDLRPVIGMSRVSTAG